MYSHRSPAPPDCPTKYTPCLSTPQLPLLPPPPELQDDFFLPCTTSLPPTFPYTNVSCSKPVRFPPLPNEADSLLALRSLKYNGISDVLIAATAQEAPSTNPAGTGGEVSLPLRAPSSPCKYFDASLSSSKNAKCKRPRLFECEVCRKKFAYESHLTRHMRVHTGEKPFQCTLCKKRFSEHSNLKTHYRRIHSKSKLYQCKVCNKGFSVNGDLKKHFRTHSREKPFACDLCGKLFADRSNLAQHKRSHTGEKPYECEICGRLYSRRSSLTRHIGKAHSIPIKKKDQLYRVEETNEGFGSTQPTSSCPPQTILLENDPRTCLFSTENETILDTAGLQDFLIAQK